MRSISAFAACSLLTFVVLAQSPAPTSRPRHRAEKPKPGTEAPKVEEKSTAELLDGWASWSESLLKALVEAKAIAGQDLSSTRGNVATITANVTRLKRAIALEKEFSKAEDDAETRFLQSVDALITKYADTSLIGVSEKNSAIAELERMQKAVEVQVAALGARKQLLYSLGQDLGTMNTRCANAIRNSKLDPGKTAELLGRIAPLGTAAPQCQAASEKDDHLFEAFGKRQTAISEAIATLRSLHND